VWSVRVRGHLAVARLGVRSDADLAWETELLQHLEREGLTVPAPNSDVYDFAEALHADELAIAKRVHTYLETKVQAIINKYWAEDSFPFELLPSFSELNISSLGNVTTT